MNDLVEKIKDVLVSLEEFIVGYRDLIKLIGVALLSEGHILIEGPPGTGKTTIARLFARLIGGSFKRIQMTPDLLPSDVIGSFFFDIKAGKWVLRRGPIFANIVFIDELNRAPPRTQSALLEAMQERRVTIEGNTLDLPRPFLVIASQMPGTASEGIYPLTPTLIDRFAYSYRSSYLPPEDEIKILKKAEEIEAKEHELKPIVNPNLLIKAQELVRNVYVSDKILKYIVDLVSYIRSRDEVQAGPSPRASIWLYRGARALALLDGMEYVVPDHVKWLARYVISHRIILKPEYEVEGVKPEDIIREALNKVEVPKI